MAPGWIFGRGDCGYMGGRTVYDIMEVRQYSLCFCPYFVHKMYGKYKFTKFRTCPIRFISCVLGTIKHEFLKREKDSVLIATN